MRSRRDAEAARARLLLRGVSATTVEDQVRADWMDWHRHFFARGIATNLAMPVLASDTVDHVGEECADPLRADFFASHPPTPQEPLPRA